MKTKLIFLFAVLSAFSSSARFKKKVLFLGNSYSNMYNLPQIIKEIALSKTDTLITEQNLMGGYTFQSHYNDAQTYVKLFSDTWDFVVIQGQSQEPALSPNQVMSNSYPYAKRLADSARKANPCTEVLFFMTWGRKNGDAFNCGSYPPVCTFNGMQARLRESYLMFADSFNASCAPVGVAWQRFRNTYPLVELYQNDDSHPVEEGAYLTACTLYSSIFKKHVSGATYYFTLDQALAQNMQQVAGNTVMDSVQVWNLNSLTAVSDFTYDYLGWNVFQFHNLSLNASTYTWSFGSTQASPQHTFSGTPPYVVSLQASNTCSSASTTYTIANTAIGKNNPCEATITHEPLANAIRIEHCGNLEKSVVSIYDLAGKKMASYHNTSRIALDDFERGIYLIEIRQGDKSMHRKIILQ
jgi:hypothetical protein